MTARCQQCGKVIDDLKLKDPCPNCGGMGRNYTLEAGSGTFRVNSLFERFSETKEEGFREQFIRPLLIRLGFVGITNKHGSQEYGKDYVFSELDKFGQLRHMVVQAKHEESIGQGTKVDGLLSQVRQAFNVPFTLPSSPSEERFVAAVYVFNSGTITQNAITQIRRGLAKEHATNTHFFDGDQLEAISATITAVQDRQSRQRLIALIDQLGLNIGIWQSLQQVTIADDAGWDLREGIIHGLEEYFTSPVLADRDILNDVAVLWQDAKIIRGIVARHALQSIRPKGDIRQKDYATLNDVCRRSIHRAQVLTTKLLMALDKMYPDTF
jgi:hypothetical protein